MKENVDLTENRDFHNNITFLNQITERTLTQLIYKVLPWDQGVPNGYVNSKEIIPIGNKIERSTHHSYEKYKVGLDCER